MSKVTKYSIGDRVQLIPFKHKGKQGHIKFIGEIEGKAQGNWVGVELDDANGDCSGMFNDVQIFECKENHGIFLRPTQVKSLESSSNVSNMDQSSIMPVNESMVSTDLFSSTVGKQESQKLLDAIGTDANAQGSAVQVTVMDTDDQGAPVKPPAADTPVGRIKGWKERLDLMRKQKQQQIEESRLTNNESTDKVSGVQEEQNKTLTDIFAPAAGLERNQDGKFEIEKEKVEKKKEIEYEKKEENLVEAELKAQKNKKEVSTIQEAEKLTSSPSKPKIGGLSQTNVRASDPAASSRIGGLKRPTTGIGGKPSGTLEKRQTLVEKQKMLNAKRDEKDKKDAAGGARAPGSRLGAGGSRLGMAGRAGATTRTSGAATSRLGSSAKSGEASTGAPSRTTNSRVTSSRLGTARGSTSTAGGVTDRGTSSTESGSTSKRESSASRGIQPKFGRQNSATRGDKDLTGVKARGRSGSRDAKDLQFGKSTATRDRSKSKEGPGMNFRSANLATAASKVTIPEDSQIIKKKELQDLKDELEKHKDELYQINIKMKKVENQTEILKRDHADELEKVVAETNEANKKVQEELVMKHSEERNKLILESNQSNDDKLNKLQAEYAELQKQRDELEEKLKQTIEDMTASYEEEKVKLIEEKDAKYAEMETGLQTKIQEHEKEAEVNKDQCQKLLDKVKSCKVEIDELAETVQANKIDLEANQLELEMLKDEKTELLAEMTQSAKIDQEDILNSLSADELKQQNRKLRQAITSLAANFEMEKEKLQKQVEDEEGKKKLIEQYEKKLVDMDVLLEELDRKEEELAEVKMENEACLEYETMVEEMAQEILKKEEESHDLEKKIKQLEEILGIQEGYTEGLEQFNQEISDELAEKEAEMSALEQQKIDDEELLLDLEDENQKFREKVQQLQKTIKELQMQIESQTESGEQKSKVQQLIEKQNTLIQQIKAQEKKDVDNQLRKIDYHWENQIKQRVVENIVPPRLQENVHFDSLDRLNLLNKSSNRAMLMLRYICEQQMPNAGNMYAGDGDEDLEMKIQFIKMMIVLSDLVVNFMNSVQKMIICLSNMSVEQYVKATTTFMAWKKVENVNEEMTNIIQRLKDENISLKFDTTVLDSHIKQVSELHFKIEKLFVEKTPEELEKEPPAEKGEEDKSKYQMTPAQMERQKMLSSTYKLDCRHQALRMCYTIIALKVLMGDLIVDSTSTHQVNFTKKAQLIYGRLLDMVFKLDHIDAEDTGKQYLNMQDLVIDKRLSDKFDVIKIIWSDAADPDIVQGKDWNSIMDSIQKDISQLFNDYKFKRLIKQIEQQYESDNKATLINIDQIFFIDRFQQESSPWMEISNRIKTDIQNSEALKDKIESLIQKNKGHMQKQIQDEREISILKTTKTSLEQRLASAKTEIEMLNNVKSENKQLDIKTNALDKKCKELLKENDGQKKQIEDWVKKYEDVKDQAAKGQLALEQQAQNPQGQTMGGIFTKNRGLNQPSRQSRTSTFFQELAKTSVLGGRKVDSSMTPMHTAAGKNQGRGQNSVEMQKVLIQQEENYTSIIYQLQLDRMRLRGKDISDKLGKLQKSKGALNEFTKIQKDKQSMKMKLSRDEENTLVKAVENVEHLKTNAKMLMASIKVVDLQKKRDDMARAEQEDIKSQNFALKRIQKLKKGNISLEKSDCAKTNMNINYMIIQAREQVNEAIQNLMSKDQNLNNLQVEKMTKQVEAEYNNPNAVFKNVVDKESDGSSDDEELNEQERIKKLQAKLEERRIRLQKQKMNIGSIVLGGAGKPTTDAGGDADAQGPATVKNVVFNVRSLRALQNNIGVFSI